MFAAVGELVMLLPYPDSDRSSPHRIAGVSNTDTLENHVECVIAAIAGVILVVRQRQWRNTAFPIILLATVAVVHAYHRPWWDYYYLHFAIPLAWLSAVAISETVKFGAQALASSPIRLASIKTWLAVGGCILAGLVFVRSEKRLESTMTALRGRSSTESNHIVNQMRKFAPQTHWVYAEQDMYPFQAGLQTPPELTVVVYKRFWSGQMTLPDLIDTCKRYQVEQLVLNPSHLNSEWTNLLANYTLVEGSTNTVLYVANHVLSPSQP